MNELDALRYRRLTDKVESADISLSYEKVDIRDFSYEEHFMSGKEEIDAYLDAMGAYE